MLFIVIRNDKIRHLAVPQYEGLYEKDILGEAKQLPEVMKHLPEP